MAVRSSISAGFPSPNYVVELGQREAALPGEYVVEGGQAVVTVLTGQIDNLTLAATAAVTLVATASPTIGNLTVSSVGNIAVTATLAKTIGTLSLDATGKVIASASLDATLDPITAAAGLVIGGGDDVAVPWWWAAYVARHQAERRLAEQQARIKWLRDHTVHGDGWAVMPVPIARGALLHDPDADAADFVAALLPWLVAA